MNISQFSKATGLSAHTLRYYEKIGLITSVARNTSGHTVYSTRELEWAEFVGRLRNMGMPLKQIARYAELRAQGNSTAKLRQDILTEHATRLQAHIQAEQEHLAAVYKKIDFYKQLNISS